MMRKLLIPFLAALAIAAAPVASAADLKIGFVNTSRVLEEAPQAEAARKQLEREFAPRDGEIGEAQRRLKELEERLARDGAVMSEEERRKLERERLVQQRELKRSRKAFTEDFNLRRNEEFSQLQRVVAEVIVQFAKEQEYDVILESGVIYASDKVDITNTVLERLGERYQQSSGGQDD